MFKKDALKTHKHFHDLLRCIYLLIIYLLPLSHHAQTKQEGKEINGRYYKMEYLFFEDFQDNHVLAWSA